MSRWLDELDRAWPVRRAIVLCRNVRDVYLYRPTNAHAPELLDINDVFRRWCSRIGISVSFYDSVNRFTEDTGGANPTSLPAGSGGAASLHTGQDSGATHDSTDAGLQRERAARTPRREIAAISRRLLESENLCMVVQGAEWLVPARPTNPEDRSCLVALENLIREIPESNKLVLVFIDEEQIPAQIVNLAPRTARISIADPSRKVLRTLFTEVYGFGETDADKAVNSCFGMSLFEVNSIARYLGATLEPDAFEKAARRYRYGEETNYWSELSLDRLRHAHDFFVTQEGVKGQDEAVNKVRTVLIRARADIQRTTGGNPGRPRGALFFAGPTGVGKTFMAQKVAKFLFDDERNMVRLDMSEYAQEHQVARLYGAPPGYIGYEQGGTLTNAVERNPFCVVLFDEIEKADPSIFDIFLQILGDGRLTDSRGHTVHFSETFIVFTSNLGADTADAAELEQLKGDRARRHAHFIDAVEGFFKTKLRRPELLNRIGRENIVVFNYIDSEETGREILAHHLRRIVGAFNKSYSEQQPRLRIDTALDDLADHLYELDAERITLFGGREVENLVNRLVRDNLAECVLDAEARHLESAVISVRASEEGLDFSVREQE